MIQNLLGMAQNDYPVIHIRTNHSEYKKFQFLKEHGYSAREVLELTRIEIPLTVKSKITDKPIEIPANILSKRKKS